MSLQRADVHQALSRILDDEARLLAELEALLQEETAILRRDDVEAISPNRLERQRCVDALTRLDGERADTCRMLSFGQGRGALAKLYEWSDASGALNSRWLANLQIARRCKKINDANGAIVGAKLVDACRNCCMDLRGTAPLPVYSARASRYGSLGSRDLGRA